MVIGNCLYNVTITTMMVVNILPYMLKNRFWLIIDGLVGINSFDARFKSFNIHSGKFSQVYLLDKFTSLLHMMVIRIILYKLLKRIPIVLIDAQPNTFCTFVYFNLFKFSLVFSGLFPMFARRMLV